MSIFLLIIYCGLIPTIRNGEGSVTNHTPGRVLCLNSGSSKFNGESILALVSHDLELKVSFRGDEYAFTDFIFNLLLCFVLVRSFLGNLIIVTINA